MAADIVGSGGRTRVDGATLRARLGLLDTWAYFTSIATRKAKPSPTGGATPGAAAGPRPYAAVAGTVVPAREGAEVQVQLREDGRWQTRRLHVVRRGGALPRRRRERRHLPRRVRGRGRARVRIRVVR